MFDSNVEFNHFLRLSIIYYLFFSGFRDSRTRVSWSSHPCVILPNSRKGHVSARRRAETTLKCLVPEGYEAP